MLTACSPEYIDYLINSLSQIGGGADPVREGITRPAWSKEESAAIDLIVKEAEKNGGQSYTDTVGNTFLRWSGESEETIQIGSHLDTVPRGGRFDGAAGIVCGLAAILELSQSKKLPLSIELVIWRGEESATFGVAYGGSRAAFGTLPPAALQLSYNGISLRDQISSAGFSVSSIETRTPSLPEKARKRVIAHFELHIEQARRLELEKKAIGVVTGIRGNVRMEVTVTGEAAHSGATPMGLPYRHDANLAAAYMLVRLHELTLRFQNEGADLVSTCGVLNSNHQKNENLPLIKTSSLTRVSPLSYFTFEGRSLDEETLKSFKEQVLKVINETAAEFAVGCEITEFPSTLPVSTLSPALASLAMKACERLELPAITMPAGAGHDIAVISGSGVDSALLFIPCRDGISHSPDEFASTEALYNGTRVLHETVNLILEKRA